jgi:hypothetical protein
LLPTPEADEVVPALLEEVEVRVVVEHFGVRAALGSRAHAILEVVPDMRAGEEHGSFLLRDIGVDGEVTRVLRRHGEWTGNGQVRCALAPRVN